MPGLKTLELAVGAATLERRPVLTVWMGIRTPSLFLAAMAFLRKNQPSSAPLGAFGPTTPKAPKPPTPAAPKTPPEEEQNPHVSPPEQTASTAVPPAVPKAPAPVAPKAPAPVAPVARAPMAPAPVAPKPAVPAPPKTVAPIAPPKPVAPIAPKPAAPIRRNRRCQLLEANCSCCSADQAISCSRC